MGKQLARGVNAKGRSATKGYRGFKFSKKVNPKKPTEEKKTETKQPRWYAADDVKRPLASRKKNHKITKLRASITPGTVLILLAGRFKGRRVVFLKQLESGLLLVSGPFKINGVPLRRVDQTYVIATSTKVDVAGVDVSALKDADFAKKRVAPTKKSDGEFFKTEVQKSPLPQAKKDAQKKVDAALTTAIKKVANLDLYLAAKFGLTKNDVPHLMRF